MSIQRTAYNGQYATHTCHVRCNTACNTQRMEHYPHCSCNVLPGHGCSLASGLSEWTLTAKTKNRAPKNSAPPAAVGYRWARPLFPIRLQCIVRACAARRRYCTLQHRTTCSGCAMLQGYMFTMELCTFSTAALLVWRCATGEIGGDLVRPLNPQYIHTHTHT